MALARWRRFAIAGMSSSVLVLLLTLGTYRLRLWVGGDLSTRDPILLLFVNFPIVMGLVAAVWPSPRLSRRPLAVGAAGAAIGFVYGYVLVRVGIASFVGYWSWQVFGPISFSGDIDLAIFVCGVTAGTCALLLSLTARSRPVIATVAILISIAVFLPAPTLDFITQNQELTVTVVIPCSPDAVGEPEVITGVDTNPIGAGRLTHRVLDWIREEGITGSYRVSSIDRFGHGKQALAVIVLNQPVVGKMELQQPSGGDVIYLQLPEGWKKIPSQIPTLGRTLALEPPIGNDALAGLTIVDAYGSSVSSEIWKAPH
jgi:hypothetical protein